MAGLERYMSQYDHEHHNLANKALHAIGIPAIFASLILFVLLHWKLGIALFVFGWALLFLGHRIEGNKPAFFQGPIYFLVGPIWVLKELKDSILGRPHAESARR
ncbi:MAG: DUF962 domain-containing protein [Candidatus Acidiferrales bacterium]